MNGYVAARGLRPAISFCHIGEPRPIVTTHHAKHWNRFAAKIVLGFLTEAARQKCEQFDTRVSARAEDSRVCTYFFGDDGNSIRINFFLERQKLDCCSDIKLDRFSLFAI